MSEVRSCVVLWYLDDGQLFERTEMIFGADGHLIGCSTAPATVAEGLLPLGATPGRPEAMLYVDELGKQLELGGMRPETPGGLLGASDQEPPVIDLR